MAPISKNFMEIKCIYADYTLSIVYHIDYMVDYMVVYMVDYKIGLEVLRGWFKLRSK